MERKTVQETAETKTMRQASLDTGDLEGENSLTQKESKVWPEKMEFVTKNTTGQT